MCRIVHAEANCIISAQRREMIDSTLYLVGKDYNTGELVENTSSWSMCKRMVINAGIKQVVIRVTPTEYKIVDVNDWVENDESIEGIFGY